ncbi:RidA family protein [Brevundimonas nasdae]|uniref:RidA family protein n=1 Tax=Brevundimonas nasdae TaxID=172043 RepID=UPI003F68F830
MPITKINPPHLYESVPFGFSHAALQEGGRTLHLAGQVAWDAQCNVVGEGDLARQVEVALQNLSAVLAEAGADAGNLVRLRTYIVDNTPEKLGIVVGAINRFYAGATPAPNTVVGVSGLALPDFLVEIEATASLD